MLDIKPLMPRHRRDSVPRHRAQRRGESPGRGVLGSAADWTARLLDGRSMRSLLVTPWFAASLGVLITAMLVLESPTDAVLSYGPPAGSPCASPRCVSPGARHAPGSLAARPGARLDPGVRRNSRARHPLAAAPSRHQSARHAAPSAVSVSFQVISRDHRGFIAMITLFSRHSLGDWTLGFTIPGTSIRGVGGARWRGDGGDSGIAQAQPSPWLRSSSGAGTARFMVLGTGTPGHPTGCTFNGRSCVFS